MDDGTLHERLKASIGLSNDILSDQDELAAKTLLNQAEEMVSSIHTEILRVRSVLEILEKRYADEVEWKTRLNIGISRHKRLPREILGFIFKHCVDYRYHKLDLPPHPQSQCMVLSQVCSRWRQVALSEPSLWNAISINFPSRVRPDVVHNILSRAGRNISFESKAKKIPPALWDVIHQYSNRLKTVELYLDFSQPVQHLVDRFEQLGQLRRLLLKITNDSLGLVQMYPVVSTFRNASDLRELRIHSAFFDTSLDIGIPHDSSFPWTHLQHLEIECGILATGFLQIMVQCPQLVSCDVVLDRDDDHDTFLAEHQLDTFIMKKLHSLKLSTHEDDISWLLYFLNAPLLSKLHIYHFQTTSDALFHFIERTEYNIRVLDITMFPGSSPELEKMMRIIPKAKELCLWGCTISDHVLQSLSTRDLLPDLETLSLEGRFGSLRAVQELISKRCNTEYQNSRGVINDFYLRISKRDMTDEWREFAASLPEGGAVRFGTPYR